MSYSHVRSGARLATIAAAGACLTLGVPLSLAVPQFPGDGMKVAPTIPDVGDVKTPPQSFPREAISPEREAALATPAFVGPVQTPAGGLQLPTLERFDSPAYDVAADGSMWARGRTYKAHFTSGGLEYVPAFGAFAPRNYPIAFSLAGVEADGAPLLIEHAQPMRADARISIDRGVMTEVYQLAADSVEQMFVFDERPGSGDLSVRLNVHTDLTSADSGDAFIFANDLGHVSYTKAVVIDAANNATAVPTELVNGEIRIVVSDSLLDKAAFPITIDPVITTFAVAASTGGVNDGHSDIAYDASSDSYLVVWEEQFSATDGDIYAEARTSAGAFIDASLSTIDSSTADVRGPRVANNNLHDQYLVVMTIGSPTVKRVFGRTRNASNAATGALFQISNDAFVGDQLNVDVGGDPNLTPPTYYCVVWQRTFSATDQDILARLVDPATIAPFGGVIPLENSSSSLDRNPAISNSNGAPPFANQDWTIAWQRREAPGDEDILGARIHWNGSITNATFAIDTTGTNDVNPTVSSPLDASRDVMVVYEENGSFLYSRVMDGTAVLTGGNLQAIENVFPGTIAANPVADATADRFIVGYTQTGVGVGNTYPFVSTYCVSNGSLRPAEQHRRLSSQLVYNDQPALTAAHSGGNASGLGSMLTWTRRDVGEAFGEIRGGVYDAHATCCMADIAPAGGDGEINIDDLLTVISGWGSGGGATTVSDIDGDYVTNIDDLLMVIAAWGACQ